MKRLQILAYSWAIRCFGKDHVDDPRVRFLRLLEEVAEAAQVCFVEKDKLIEVIEKVYSRPMGELSQELGGIAVTFAVVCESQGYQIPDLLMTELNRVLSKPESHFTKRNLEKVQP